MPGPLVPGTVIRMLATALKIAALEKLRAREAVFRVSMDSIPTESAASLIKHFTGLYAEQVGDAVTEGMPMHRRRRECTARSRRRLCRLSILV